MRQDTTGFRARKKIKDGVHLPSLEPDPAAQTPPPAPPMVTATGQPYVKRTANFATAHRKQRMIAALKEHLGIVCYAAEAAGVNANTHYGWMRKDPAYREAVMEAEDRMIGFTERKLLELVKEKDREACKFVLDRRGGRHGWGKSIQINGPDGGPILMQHSVDLQFLQEEAPLEGLVKLVEILKGMNVPGLLERPVKSAVMELADDEEGTGELSNEE